MVRDEPLRVEVELVDADVGVAEVEHLEPLPVVHADLHHQAASGRKMPRRVLEHRNLSVLRGDVVDRVEDDVGERERPLHSRGRHVADLDPDLVRLRSQLRDHVRREVDAGDPHASGRERHRDPAGADRQLEGAAARQRLQEVDDRLDWHAGRRGVVALRDLACEPVLRHPARFSFPCRFACRSPTRKTARPIGVARTAMISSGQTSAHAMPAPLMIEARHPRSA